jgi:CelD/BcsL family acetyltransferase involved in cellulose biosynthesis
VHESLEKNMFFDYIFTYKGWDLIITDNIESELKITKAYIEYLDSSKKKYKIEQGFMSPFLTTESSWDDYWKTLSKSFRTNLNTGMNRLKKDKKTINVYKVVDYEIFDRILDKLLEASARSWKGETGSDLRSTPELLSFYIDFSRKASEMGLFELWVLEIDDKIAVFDYHLACSNALSLIRTDFDIKYKFYNPGNTLKLFILKDLFTRGQMIEYDMGGHVVDYKAKWAHNIKRHYIITAGSTGIYGGLLMIGKLKVLPIVRKLRMK